MLVLRSSLGRQRLLARPLALLRASVLGSDAPIDIEALGARWEEAPRLVAAAREEAAFGRVESLPAYADRLEGRAAAAAGETGRGAELLGRSAERFAELEARWEEAWSRLLLAEVVAAGDPQRAEAELARALPVFEELGSVHELEAARALRAAVGA